MENNKIIFIEKLTDYYNKINQSAGKRDDDSDIYPTTTDQSMFNSKNKDDINIRKIFKEDYKNINNSTFKNLDGKVYKTNLDNSVDTPWFDWMANGKISYNALLNEGKWRRLKTNDVIIFNDENGNKLKTSVADMKYFKNFKDAYQSLGKQLIPINGINNNDVESYYWKYYNQNDIDNNGVLAIGLNMLNKK